MNSPGSQEIIGRFFELLGELIAQGKYASIYDFAKQYGYNNTNMYISSTDFKSNRFQVEWMQPLINEHNISMDYIISGKGKKRASKPVPVTKI